MKKLLGILSVVVLLVCSSNHAKAFTIDIVFGAPTSTGCIGFGICSISTEFLANQPNSGHGDLSLTANGKLKFIFTSQSMSKETIGKYFSNNVFRVDADYVLPAEIAQMLNLSSTYTIKKGVYTVVKNSTTNSFELIL